MATCTRELSEANALRGAGAWLRAERRLEGALGACGKPRERHEAALVDLILLLDDSATAGRVLASLGETQCARLKSWLEQRPLPTDADVSEETRALRALRAGGAPNALEYAETILARSGARGEVLAEVGLLRAATEGLHAAQPYFDRARVALERETGRTAEAFLLQSAVLGFDGVAWTPDARELWLKGPARFGGEEAQPESSVILDAATWEPIWRFNSTASECASVPLANGAGFARCDGVFSRNGQRLHELSDVALKVTPPLTPLPDEARLLFARKEGERSTRLGWLNPITAAFDALPMPAIERLLSIGAGPTRDWFLIESATGVEVFAYPSLKSILRVKASAAQPLDADHVAFISAADDLEVWQLHPPKRVARHYLPAIVLPHGPSIGSTYFRSADPEQLWVTHLSREWSWRWKQNPLITPEAHVDDVYNPPDEMSGQSLRDVTVSSDGHWAAELRRDDRLEHDELHVTSKSAVAFTALSAAHLKSFALSPNGKQLALNIAGKNLALLDLDSGRITGTLEFVAIRHLAAYDDQHMALELPAETWLIDVRDGSHTPLPLPPRESFYGRGSSGLLVTTDSSGQANSYDAQGKLLRSFFSLTPSALSPSGTWLLLKDEARLALASTTQGTRALINDAGNSLEAWRFSRNEHRLATLSKSGLVVWDTESGNKWGISAPPGLGRVRSLDFANDDEVVVLRQANGDAIAFRYASNERVPPPALAFEDGAAVQWSLASHFLSAFRRSDGAWLGAVGLLGGGSSGVVVSAGGELDFIGAEPVPQPRCAFGNVLAAWPVCSDTQLVPGLLKRLLRDAGPR